MVHANGGKFASSAVLGEFVEFGDNVTVHDGAIVTGRVRLTDGTVISAGATLEGPRAGDPISIGPAALVGAGAVVSACDVGQDAIVRPGAVVTRNVPARSVVEGNPARVVRTRLATNGASEGGRPEPHAKGRPGAERLIKLTSVDDMRGSLVAAEVGGAVPFAVQRVFSVFGVPGPEVRGEHAHRECHQLLIALAGSLEVICDDGDERVNYHLDSPDYGLHIPPMIWGIQHRYSSDAVLLVLASKPYEDHDYIRSYQEFRDQVHSA